MEIIHFEPEHYDKLLEFSKKFGLKKQEEYLKYRLFKIPEQIEDNKNNFLLLNDSGEIVGCTLYIPTRARINGKEEKVLWGHDVFVEEQYRGAAGLLLLIEQLKIKSSFGFGATEVNFKIQKELGTKYIGVAKHYVIFNIWSFKLFLYKLKLIPIPDPNNFISPNFLEVGKYKFHKVSNVKELKIPDGGYWTGAGMDIEFIRDEHFLKNRFFENFKKYHFYNLDLDYASEVDECYLVVRPVTEGGFSVLSVVDFRYNLNKPEQLKLVLRAGAKLGLLNRFLLVTIRTSVKYKKINLYPLLLRTSSQQHIGTFLPIETNLRLFVTNGDSDSDFLLD